MASAVKKHEDEEPKKSVVQISAEKVLEVERIIRFRGRALVLVYQPFPHYVPLTKDRFEEVAYRLLGGVTRSRISDTLAFATNIADDLTPYESHVLFGVPGLSDEEMEDVDALANHVKPTVWDMKQHTQSDVPPKNTIWRSPYKPVFTDSSYRVPFIMDLAGQDEGLYDDIMQSLAPLIMEKKPDGVIWWIGDGANGKSTLMDAIYRIFPDQFSSLNVKQLTDGRDTPGLNGVLANVVRESSEGKIDDTQIYKSIGTHENFSIHKFHSQDSITIRGNLHHIFSGNSIPVFNDKGHSARRRTFIVPFTQTFESDPSFEERTFTPQFFGELIWEMCKYAIKIEAQGYKYKWSAATLGAKVEYDTEANNAEEYSRQIISEGVVAFNNFNLVKGDYESWCADNGYVPLGINNLRRALQVNGFERMSVAGDGGRINKHYRLPTVTAEDLVQLHVTRPGLFTTPGFKQAALIDTLSPETTATTTTTQVALDEGKPKKEFKW